MSTMNNLPDKWDVKPLGEACKTIKGKKPKNSGPATTERTVPYINIKAFESGQPVEFAAPGNYPTCERDDVLIVWDGARAGLSGRAVPGYIGSTLAKVYSDVADNRYLFYFLQSQYGRINSRTKGVGIPHVDPTIFNNIPFPIAPPEQQKHIVAEIEKQFSRLDEAVANLKRYKAAVLKTAVEGRLVETEAELARKKTPSPLAGEGGGEGAGYETGAQLLQRILETRRSQWKGKGKYKEPVAPDATDLPELPEGWVWSSVEAISTKVVDGVHKKPNYVPEGIPFVTVKNLTAGPGLSFAELNYVTQEDHIEFCKRTNPERGDILISKDGTLGVVRSIDTDVVFSIFVSVALVKPVLKEMQRYLVIAFESPVVQRQMVPKGSGLQHIHLEDLRADCIPLPPLPEQRRIVTEVERRFSITAEVETQIDDNLKRAERLRQSVLANGFSGQLVGAERTGTAISRKTATLS